MEQRGRQVATGACTSGLHSAGEVRVLTEAGTVRLSLDRQSTDNHADPLIGPTASGADPMDVVRPEDPSGRLADDHPIVSQLVSIRRKLMERKSPE
jgi:hypothetical protein